MQILKLSMTQFLNYVAVLNKIERYFFILLINNILLFKKVYLRHIGP
jgi:hypothetical protein